jgi:nitrate/nitrite transporter NarK
MIVRERTAEAPWLTSGEQQELSKRLAAEQNLVPAMKGFSTAFRSRVVLLLSAQYFCWSFGFFGFVLWLPSILKQGSSSGMVQTGWLSGIPYLAAIVAMIAVSFLSDKIQSRRSVVWPCLLTASLAFAALGVVGQGHFWFSFWLLVLAGAAMHAPFGPFWALIPELLPQT